MVNLLNNKNLNHAKEDTANRIADLVRTQRKHEILIHKYPASKVREQVSEKVGGKVGVEIVAQIKLQT